MRNFVSQTHFWIPQCPYCNKLFAHFFTMFLHCIRVHLELKCRLCGAVSVGYLLLTHHFLQVHMNIRVSRLMDVFRIGIRLREIPLCETSLDNMQYAAISLSRFILRRQYIISRVVHASLIVNLLFVHSASPSGTNYVPLQIDQNIVGTSHNQSPATSQSSQEADTELVENCIPLLNQLDGPSEGMNPVEDSDDEEND
ncbi:hypothetical protein POM88_012449 [Heracleum sosnowskyi]|uniref:C2H2-type domain-containing protein n=1 Tax=Heracleum sosnowskyi TaxID=360622 RepID=A0AAD8N3G1_9APIA|nr:hypothetical protein POM88_012449 [Heracleum sosnowskyi]